MATTVARLEAILSANTRDFDRAMGRSQTRMEKVGTAAKVGLAVGVGVGIKVLQSSVHAAMDAERSQARLAQAFKAAKIPIDQHSKAIEEAGKKAINLGFDDEELKDSLGSLIIATGDFKKAQDDTNVAMDIARFKGVSLEAATKTLTMAMGGSQRAAKQLGLSVQAVTTEQTKAKVAYDKAKDAINAHFDALGKLTPSEEKAKQAALDHAKAMYDGAKAAGQVADKQSTAGKVIDLVKNKVNGQADAYSKTAEGAMKRFNAKVEELQESLGKGLLPVLTNVVNQIIALSDWVGRMNGKFSFQIQQLKTITPLFANIGYFVKIAADDFHDLFVWVSKLDVVQKLPKMFDQVKTAIHDATEPLMAFLHGFQDLVKAFKWLIDHASAIGKAIGSVGGVFSRIPHGDVDPNMFKNFIGGFGTGPKSISPALYDELSGATTMGLHLTSGYRPGARTKHGTKSDHSYYPSKAIDVAGAPSQMARFFRWLIGQTDVKQAFYDPLGSIFGGALSSYREGGHSDHVHVATYDKGGFLQPGWNLAYNGLGRPEPVGAMGDINLFVDGQKLFTWFQNAERKNNRRNSR